MVRALPFSPAKQPLELLIAAPRGFCAGVDRAIRIVELAIEQRGAPVYVRHEIVHNKHVVDELKAKGAVFVEELDEVPDGVPVVFSAHGVPKAVPHEAAERGLDYLDATCPLVSKVHRQADRLHAAGRHILFIGHRGHPEVVGTLGQLPAGAMTLVETVEDVLALARRPEQLGFLTQTTLSVDDTAEMVATLRNRFPAIQGPRGEDICYATSNRQAAVKEIAPLCDAIVVIGAANSSNSVRLAEVAERNGTRATLIPCADALDWSWLEGVRTLGLTAGASAPESLVRGLVDRLRERYAVTEREMTGRAETMTFKLPARSNQPERRVMAVYTHVPAEALADLLVRYDVGTLVSAKGIAEGVENSNYLVETTVGRYILTLYEKRVAADDLPFFLGVLDHLAAAGCPVPPAISDRDGRAIQEVEGRPACLIRSCRECPSPSPPLPRRARRAVEMGRMHRALKSFTGHRANTLGVDSWEPLLRRCGDDLDRISPSLHREIARRLDAVRASWDVLGDLPTSVIHADLFPDNVLMLGGQVTGLIDFYFACTDLRLYDLAVMHSSWSFDPTGRRYDAAVGRALLDGYAESFGLTDGDRAALLTLAKGACIRFALTRAWDWLNTPMDALVTRKDPLAYTRRLDFYDAGGHPIFDD